MNRWLDPRVAISFSLILLFAYAYIHNPTEAMTGALIAAFAAAYGFWIGASKSNETASENTGKAFDAMTAIAQSQPLQTDTVNVTSDTTNVETK